MGLKVSGTLWIENLSSGAVFSWSMWKMAVQLYVCVFVVTESAAGCVCRKPDMLETNPEERDARTVVCMQLASRISSEDLEEFFSSVGKV